MLVLLCAFLRIFSASWVSSSWEWLESEPVDLFHLAWTILLTCSKLFISSSANKFGYFSQPCAGHTGELISYKKSLYFPLVIRGDAKIFHIKWQNSPTKLDPENPYISQNIQKKIIFPSPPSERSRIHRTDLLTVFVLQAAELDLVGLVLGLLLQPARPAGKLVLLFAGFGSALKR